MTLRPLTALFLLLVACSDDTGMAGDASIPDSGVSTVEVMPPVAPEAPRLGDCPEGWISIDRGGVPSCAPWAEGVTAASCGDGEALFVGEGCARIGPPCGAGRFADDLPTAASIIYVDDEASAPGDGSEGAPFATLEDAVAAADTGDVIALSRGTHEAELIRPRAGVTLHGACVEETTVSAPSPDTTGATIVAAADGVVLRNLRITGPRVGVLATADVQLESVLIEGPRSGGVVTQASVAGQRVVVRDVMPEAGSTGGEGIVAIRGGQVELESVVLERTEALGVLGLSTGTQITLRRVRIADVGGLGRGIELQDGASASLTEVAMDTDGLYGYATDASRLSFSRAMLRGGSTIEINGGSTFSLSRADLDETYSAAIAVFDATATIEDALITRTLPDIAGESGFGLYGDGADLTVERSIVSDSRTVGVYLVGGTATLSDLEVARTTHHEAWGVLGQGMQITEGADLTIRRAVIRDNEEAAITVAHAGTRLDAEDLRAEGSTGRQSDGLHGIGISVFAGAELVGTRVAIHRNRQTGVAAIQNGRVTLDDVEISQTMERACATDACAGFGFGSGLITDQGGTATMTNFVVRDNALCGVRVLSTGAVDLSRGRVADNPIGANVQAAGFDTERLADEVLYEGNERNLARDDLPAPGLPEDLAVGSE
jgi:hypothetical protein